MPIVNSKSLKPELLSEFQKLRDQIIGLACDCGCVIQASDPNLPPASVLDTLKFVDSLIVQNSGPSKLNQTADTCDERPQDIARGVRCRNDLQSPKQKADWIEKFGYQAWEELPHEYKRPTLIDPARACRDDLKQLTDKERIEFIQRHGGAVFEEIMARKWRP